MKSSRVTTGVISLVITVAILCQIASAFTRPPWIIGNLEEETTGYGLGWPREFLHWHVTEYYDCEWESRSTGQSDDLLFAGDPTLRVIETRTNFDFHWIQIVNLFAVITWWAAIGGCIVTLLALLQLRWSLKSLLLLQASIAVLIFLR